MMTWKESLTNLVAIVLTPVRLLFRKKRAMKLLNLVMEQQAQTQWCWAAVAVSTHRFYGGTTWGQCELVNSVLGYLDCCDKPCPELCNQAYRLGDALKATGNFSYKKDGAEEYSTIRSELEANRPLCARIDWARGGAHFVSVIGYEDSDHGGYLHVEDPIRGLSVVSVQEFSRRYQGHGTWGYTYFTK